MFWTPCKEASMWRQEALGKAFPAAIKKLLLTNLLAAGCDAQNKRPMTNLLIWEWWPSNQNCSTRNLCIQNKTFNWNQCNLWVVWPQFPREADIMNGRRPTRWSMNNATSECPLLKQLVITTGWLFGRVLGHQKIPTNLVEACCAGTREPFYWKYEEAADGKASPT